MAAKKRRQRPALVSAYLEGVSAKTLESYQDIIRDLIVREQGIYALYKGKRLYYVGLASNLRNRLLRLVDCKPRLRLDHVVRPDDTDVVDLRRGAETEVQAGGGAAENAGGGDALSVAVDGSRNRFDPGTHAACVGTREPRLDLALERQDEAVIACLVRGSEHSVRGARTRAKDVQHSVPVQVGRENASQGRFGQGRPDLVCS